MESQSEYSNRDKQIMHFALLGAAGYIAPRHMKAIIETSNTFVGIG